VVASGGDCRASKPDVVYAFLEAVPPQNALYRSENGGKTWQMLDRSQNMLWRPFYFANLIVDRAIGPRLQTDGGLIVSTVAGKASAASAARAWGLP